MRTMRRLPQIRREAKRRGEPRCDALDRDHTRIEGGLLKRAPTEMIALADALGEEARRHKPEPSEGRRGLLIRRREDVFCDIAARLIGREHIALKHALHIFFEIAEGGRDEFFVDAEEERKEFALVVITLALLTAQPSVDMLVHPERRIDARRVDPKLGALLIRRITIALFIRADAVRDLADDARMDAEDSARSPIGAIEIAIDPVEHGLEGPLGAALRVGTIGGFLLDGVRDKRMRGLKKERAPAGDPARLLAVDAPKHRARTEEPERRILHASADLLERRL